MNPRAQVFKPLAPASPNGVSHAPAAPLHAEIKSVIRPIVQALQAHHPVKQVTIAEGRMGSVTTVAVELGEEAEWKGGVGRYTMQMAKDLFLRTAERSQSTYVVGYELEPFSEKEDGGFQVVLGVVPYSMERMVCWETYRRGFCSCRAHCNFWHPSDDDFVPVRLMFVKGQDPAACTFAKY